MFEKLIIYSTNHLLKISFNLIWLNKRKTPEPTSIEIYENFVFINNFSNISAHLREIKSHYIQLTCWNLSSPLY